MPYTWPDLASYITELAAKEGAKPNASFLRLLANQALRLLSRRALLYDMVWTSAPDGGLTLTGATAALPEDCYAVERVEWNDVDLPYRSLAWLDRRRPGWRTAQGIPTEHTRAGRYLILNAIPDPPGVLVVRGRGPLPDFPADGDGENPLQWLPADHQLLPAEYVLKELPADPANPVAQQRRADADRRWQEGLATLVAATSARESEPFRF